MKTENSEGLKFFGLSLENFKNITHKVIDIGGNSILVVGPNGSGKSSLIQALCSPLDAKIIPSEPIKKGEERSKVEVVLGGKMGGKNVKYTLDLFFSGDKQKGRLVVYNEQGEKLNTPATFVKSLIGNVSFDIVSWLHESNEKKLKMLKQLTGCEVEIDKINKVITEKKSDKKHKKQRFEDLEAILKNHGMSSEEIEKYSIPVDIQPLQEELKNISSNITQYSEVEKKFNGFKETIENEEKAISNFRKLNEEKEAQIKALQAQIETANGLIADCFTEIERAKGNIRKGEEWFEKTKRPNAEEINNRINEAIAHNEKVNQVSKLAEQQREMLTAKQEVNKIDSEIEKMEEERMSMIKKSQLPINGLTFTEDSIMIDGLPLEEGQLNTARLFDIGVEVAMALNPNLKVIFLHDASLFDKKTLEMIIRKAEAKGFQIVAEIVQEGDLDVKFTEYTAV